MFGLLRLDTARLGDTEAFIYEAHYCGLCNALSREYGQISRIMCSYDLALIHILLDAAASANCRIIKVRCPVRLHKRRACLRDESSLLADISVLLCYEKLIDDEHDEPQETVRFIKAYVQRKYHRCRYRLQRKNFDVSYIHDLLVGQRAMERDLVHNFSKISERSALMMKYILGFLSEMLGLSASDQETFEEMGYNLGRWIYLIDSLIDFEKDSSMKRFNPILLKCNFSGTKAVLHEIPETVKSEITIFLDEVLKKIRNCLERLELRRYQRLIRYAFINALREKTDIFLKALKNVSCGSRCDFDIIDATLAGTCFPRVAFASQSNESICGSCAGPLISCAILACLFKWIFQCLSGRGGCFPCSTEPKTVRVDSG
ncbi:MAG: hypothetical protein DRH12_11975, partial [Deltaproteobacteria bacterium]